MFFIQGIPCFNKNKKRGARGVRTLVLGLIRGITFPLHYTLFVVHCKMLCLLYKVSHVLIRTKKRGEMGHWGLEQGSPKQEPSGLPVRRAIFCEGIRQLNFLYIIVVALHWRANVWFILFFLIRNFLIRN